MAIEQDIGASLDDHDLICEETGERLPLKLRGDGRPKPVNAIVFQRELEKRQRVVEVKKQEVNRAWREVVLEWKRRNPFLSASSTPHRIGFVTWSTRDSKLESFWGWKSGGSF